MEVELRKLAGPRFEFYFKQSHSKKQKVKRQSIGICQFAAPYFLEQRIEESLIGRRTTFIARRNQARIASLADPQITQRDDLSSQISDLDFTNLKLQI